MAQWANHDNTYYYCRREGAVVNRIACLLLGVVVVLSVDRCLAAAPPRSAESAIVRANRGLAVDLYGRLAKENQGKDLFFSPYSISTALAMTAPERGGTPPPRWPRPCTWTLTPPRSTRRLRP